MACAGCALATPAAELLEAPKFDPPDQTQCKIKKSQSKPLVVEWPSPDRMELETRAKSGTVVVAYSGCEMRLLAHCRAPGTYRFVAGTPKKDRIVIRNADELWAAIPMGAARFEGRLEKAGQLTVAMTIVGRYSAERPQVRRADLEGLCDGATHVVVGLTVGAFEFFAGAAAEVGGGVEVVGVGAGGRSVAKHETITSDGDPAACRGSREQGPPADCGALIRVEVLPIGASPTADPTCPEGSTWDGQACVRQDVQVRCPAGTHWDGSVCVGTAPPSADPVPAPAPPPPAPPPAQPPTAPTAGGQLTVLTDERIETKQKIRFAYNKATIKPESYALLDEVADILLQRPALYVEVQGHTDNAGSASYNKKLSQQRAEAVRKYLIGRGVDPSRISAAGYGEERPIDSNQTRTGRATNRRIEFHLR